MRIPNFIAGLAVIATFAPIAHEAIAAEDSAVTLEPATPWNLDVGEHRCRLARIFGDEDSRTLFVVDQWDPAPIAWATVSGPSFKRFRDGRETQYEFSEGGEKREFDLIASTFDRYGPAVTFNTRFVFSDEPVEVAYSEIDDDDEASGEEPNTPRGLPRIDSDGAEGIRFLTVEQRNRPPVRLHLGSMKAPLDAMNSCMESLVEHWGFDLEEQRRVVVAPKVTNFMRVVREIAKEYPQAAVREGAQANFHIRLTIDEAGDVESCVLLNQTVADHFNLKNHPCKVFERYAQIEPALDVDGNPVRTFMAHRIAYRMGR
ncbi:energy transducer TonB [Qipengyuania vesicularis]|uniref:energy transducer TonB n=1 Tax=Qipengyuania vesicularis TaxID=2867232 RepID=UPI001C86F6CE|nr:energy transducer TonB [Qipengyuania vesicularis]MBX7528306.1 energy transducer TonB [Qipengyuania vesicularis]